MSDDRGRRNPVHRAVEVVLFAPVGLLFEAPTLLPRLVDRGRREASSLVEAGLGLVGRGGEEGDDGGASHTRQALRALGLVAVPDATSGDDAAGASDDTVRGGDVEGADVGDGAATGQVPPVAGSAQSEPGPDPSTLAIPDYESLSASQVIPRLASLTAEELEAIRAFEVHNRHRSTILGKIAQLQAD